MNSLTFLYVVYGVTIVIYFAVVLIATFSVIPMQRREAKVKDDLYPIRRQFHWKGELTRMVAVTSIIALTSRFFISDVNVLRYVITTMILFTALEVLIKLLIERSMYKRKFFEVVKKKRKLTNSR